LQPRTWWRAERNLVSSECFSTPPFGSSRNIC
jgi:hypothetical protein